MKVAASCYWHICRLIRWTTVSASRSVSTWSCSATSIPIFNSTFSPRRYLHAYSCRYPCRYLHLTSICSHTCILHIFVTHTQRHTHIYIYIYIFMYIYIYIYLCTYIYIILYTYPLLQGTCRLLQSRISWSGFGGDPPELFSEPFTTEPCKAPETLSPKPWTLDPQTLNP